MLVLLLNEHFFFMLNKESLLYNESKQFGMLYANATEGAAIYVIYKNGNKEHLLSQKVIPISELDLSKNIEVTLGKMYGFRLGTPVNVEYIFIRETRLSKVYECRILDPYKDAEIKISV